MTDEERDQMRAESNAKLAQMGNIVDDMRARGLTNDEIKAELRLGWHPTNPNLRIVEDN